MADNLGRIILTVLSLGCFMSFLRLAALRYSYEKNPSKLSSGGSRATDAPDIDPFPSLSSANKTKVEVGTFIVSL